MLDKHQKLAIDFDKTLIQHPNSKGLQQYIVKNSHRKDFFIITFRTGVDFTNLWLDLDLCKETNISKHHFKGAFGIPDWIEEEYYITQLVRYANFGTKQRNHCEERYLLWKGYQAKKLGCTVLVDDMTDRVIKGCVKYNVEYVHPDQLTGVIV